MTGTLYLVSTPIGNLGDMTLRALETLKSVDFIAAEDTRVTHKLLRHFEVDKEQVSYYEHNRRQRGEEIAARLEAGQSCALVTDAGTPAISDPGEDLVALCAGRGIPVAVVPGPCAAIAALSLSGLPSGRFCFEGFLSVNKKSRREHLAALKDETRTMIFYEAPHKLCQTLSDLLDAFGPRPVALCRELTKLHEECLRMRLDEATEYFHHTAPRGEFVLVVAGAEPAAAADPLERLPQALERVEQLRGEGLGLKAAARQAAEEFDIGKNTLYQQALASEQP